MKFLVIFFLGNCETIVFNISGLSNEVNFSSLIKNSIFVNSVLMQIHKKFFPEVMQDNETAYFNHLSGIIDSVDELSTMEITKKPNAYHFRLAPSLPKYNNILIEELLKFHNMFGIRMNMSKSIKTSGSIVFEINLDNSK